MSLTDTIASAISAIKNNTGPSDLLTQATGIAGQTANLNLLNKAVSAAKTGDFSGLITGVADKNAGNINKIFGILDHKTLSRSGATGAEPGNSLGGALARSDPLVSHCWYALMPDVTPIGGAPTSLPWYYVEEATTGLKQIQTRSIFYQARARHYPGDNSVDPLRLAIYADTDNVAQTYIDAWQGAVIAPTTAANAETSSGRYGRPSGYKKTINIYIIDATKKMLATIDYLGCWPTTIDAWSLDSNTSTRLLNHVSFSVDEVHRTLYNLK